MVYGNGYQSWYGQQSKPFFASLERSFFNNDFGLLGIILTSRVGTVSRDTNQYSFGMVDCVPTYCSNSTCQITTGLNYDDVLYMLGIIETFMGRSQF